MSPTSCQTAPPRVKTFYPLTPRMAPRNGLKHDGHRRHCPTQAHRWDHSCACCLASGYCPPVSRPDPTRALTRRTWSGRRGSNPHHQLGRLRPYHWTTPAKMVFEKIPGFRIAGNPSRRPLDSTLTPEPTPTWLVQTCRDLLGYRLAVGEIIPDFLPLGQAFFQLFSTNSFAVYRACTARPRGEASSSLGHVRSIPWLPGAQAPVTSVVLVVKAGLEPATLGL